MRIFIIPAFLFCWTITVVAQEAAVPQPSEPFPFAVSLTTPDSAHVWSSQKVFSEPHRATLLAFWLTTCFPCATELDVYARHYAEWREQYDLRIVAISMDFPDRFRQIAQRMTDKKYPFEVYWDAERAFKYLLPGGLNGYPQVFLFDQNGRLVWRHKGFQPGAEAEMIEQVARLK